MKKEFSTFLLCIFATGTTIAQNITFQARDISVVPSSLTSNGKPAIVTIDRDEDGIATFKIHDENLNETKSFTYALDEISYGGSYQEEAHVIPTGVKDGGNTQITPSYEWSSAVLLNIKSAEDFANALNTSDDSYTGFTDIDGNICCYNSTNQPRFCGDSIFGKKYPFKYITLINGEIYDVSRTYEFVYDEENIEWHRKDSYPYSKSFTEISSIDYTDYDNNHYAEDIMCSQKLFNDDDAWEFVVPVTQVTLEYGTPTKQWNANSMTLTRWVSKSSMTLGYKIVTENGSTLSELNTDIYRALRINGKNLFKSLAYGGNRSSTVLFTLDYLDTSVKNTYEVNKRRLTEIEADAILVNTQNENGQIMLTNMAGGIVDRKTVNGETAVRFNTRHLPKGVYNVTLQRDGQTIANEKVLVK